MSKATEATLRARLRAAEAQVDQLRDEKFRLIQHIKHIERLLWELPSVSVVLKGAAPR